MEYSVIDIETTGFSPRKYDRIIEIGVVKIDEDGNVIEIFETLINPKRDVGPTHIHGITAEMLVDAPEFHEVSDHLLNLINGTIIIAHNAKFDMGFLSHEFELAGYAGLRWPYICTLDLARELLSGLPSNKLVCICEFYDIPHKDIHSALPDSIATSIVFNKLKDEFGIVVSDEYIFKKTDNSFIGESKAIPKTRNDFKKLNDAYISPLEKLISRLPDISTNVEKEKQYLATLDDILLDRIISDDELNTLSDFAFYCEISKNEMISLNKKYLENLIKVYLNDDVISFSERADIEKVKKILMLEDIDIDVLIDNIRNTHEAEIGPAESSCIGKSVCFTGQLQSMMEGKPITRDIASKIATSKGLIVKKGVVKNLDYLVLADVHSQSSKAKKARSYGVTLISENAFWSMLGVQVE